MQLAFQIDILKLTNKAAFGRTARQRALDITDAKVGCKIPEAGDNQPAFSFITANKGSVLGLKHTTDL